MITELMTEALFASDLQPSQHPSAGTVRTAVTASILRHGADGCAAIVATEFGDHPETAVVRMRWVRDSLAAAEHAAAPVAA